MPEPNPDWPSPPLVFMVDGAKTLPVYMFRARTVEEFSPFGRGKVQILCGDPEYVSEPFSVTPEWLERIARDAEAAKALVGKWQGHVKDYVLFLQVRDNTGGEKAKALHGHTALVSALCDERLKIETAPLWETFEAAVHLGWVYSEFRSDSEREERYEQYAARVASAYRGSRLCSHADAWLIERILRQIELKASAWGELPPLQQPTSTTRSSDVLADAFRQIPSLEQLDELVKSIEQFVWHDEREFRNSPWAQERYRLPGFVRVVEALRPVREIAKTEGWPEWLLELICGIIKTFDVIAYSWGWGDLLKSKASRDLFIADCERKFTTSYLIPIQNAAKACKNRFTVIDRPLWLEQVSDTIPAMEFDLTSFGVQDSMLEPLWKAIIRKRMAFLFGESFPTLSNLDSDTYDFTADIVLGGTLKSACQKLSLVVSEAKARGEALGLPSPPKPVMPLKTDATSKSMTSANTSAVVISLHGIKTRGKWQHELSPILAKQGFIPVPLDYGYFLALQLLSPWSRRKKIDWLRNEYSRICRENDVERPSIIAHSFGTYLVARTIEIYEHVKFDRVILCGAIVRREYGWTDRFERSQVSAVLNDFGRMDFWAGVVGHGVEDAGSSGREGFIDLAGGRVVQIDHPEFRHGDYFYHLNYMKSWVPFLCGDTSSPMAPSQALTPNRKFRVTLLIACGIMPLLVYLLLKWMIR